MAREVKESEKNQGTPRKVADEIENLTKQLANFKKELEEHELLIDTSIENKIKAIEREYSFRSIYSPDCCSTQEKLRILQELLKEIMKEAKNTATTYPDMAEKILSRPDNHGKVTLFLMLVTLYCELKLAKNILNAIRKIEVPLLVNSFFREVGLHDPTKDPLRQILPSLEKYALFN